MGSFKINCSIFLFVVSIQFFHYLLSVLVHCVLEVGLFQLMCLIYSHTIAHSILFFLNLRREVEL